MPTRTELEFYKAFGIKPVYSSLKEEEIMTLSIEAIYAVYPEIKDEQLLKLARLGFNQGFVIHSKNLEEFQEKLLKLLVWNKTDEIYHAVRKIMGVKYVR